MEQPFQSSFIPKKTVGGSSHRASGGVFSFLANLLFIVAIIASVGVFAYSKYLGGRISKMESNLSAAREALQPDLIRELSRADQRLIAANELIDKHIILSSFFEFLQSETLRTLRFNSFSFTHGEGGSMIVTMKGEAQTYATVALQASIFAQSPNFIQPQFSDLDLNEEGNVVFSFKSAINPSIVSYTDRFSGTVPSPEVPVTPDTLPVENSDPDPVPDPNQTNSL